jgi:hypothetical protein
MLDPFCTASSRTIRKSNARIWLPRGSCKGPYRLCTRTVSFPACAACGEKTNGTLRVAKNLQKLLDKKKKYEEKKREEEEAEAAED